MTNEGDDHRAISGRKRPRTDDEAKTGRRKSACQSCRLRKVKCDNARPICAICKTTETECVYLSSVLEQNTLDTVTGILTQRLDGFDTKLEELKAVLMTGHATSLPPPSFNHPSLPMEGSEPRPEAPLIAEPSRDYSHIPPQRTTADAVLNWPILAPDIPTNYLVQPLLSPDDAMSNDAVLSRGTNRNHLSLPDSIAPFNEERIPFLIDNFLENCHTKNPILDVETLVKRGRQFAVQGLGWDPWSCLVLLACALGQVAKPFGSKIDQSPAAVQLYSTPDTSHKRWGRDLQQAENCFVLACRRLGLLKPSILGAHCQFFAGVYLMYTLRPMISWQHFHQASTLYQLYLKINNRLSDDYTVVVEPVMAHGDTSLQKQRRLEQRLYWSCFKSECEFRVELPLPQSEIANYEFPALFPSPPTPPDIDLASPPAMRAMESLADVHTSTLLGLDSSSLDEDLSVRLHARKLCNEEESWYYYLTEVALRRIGNRIINSFFRRDCQCWLQIEPFINIAIEFEAQISSWSARLPPAMQRYETNSTIRAPRSKSVGGDSVGFVSRELSWATENRLLEMRSWLYQPFIYYLVHVKPTRPDHTNNSVHSGDIAHLLNDSAASPQMPEEGQNAFWNLILRGIDCNLTILETRSLAHRHHGLWYDLRAIMTASLVLLAMVKSGYGDLIPGGAHGLVGLPDAMSDSSPMSNGSPILHKSRRQAKIGGRFGDVLRRFDFWSDEAVDMRRLKEVLENLIQEIMF